MKNKILLLGATGYTGRLIASGLDSSGYDYTIASRSEEKLALLKQKLTNCADTVLFDVEDKAKLLSKYQLSSSS